jgi:hypothetical protein
LTVPSTKEKFMFRPFLVKEEKLLLMAKTSDDPSEILRAIKQVVNNCCLDEKFDVDDIAIFDIEYLFIRIRAFSINNIASVSYRDNEDNEIYTFDIDLNSIEVQFPEGVDAIIKINDSSGIVMKYPRAQIFDDQEYFNSGENAFYELVIRSMHQIYHDEDVYDLATLNREEIENFLDNLDVATYQKIVKFMESTPKLYYKIEYKNKNGTERKIELRSLADFFTLG